MKDDSVQYNVKRLRKHAEEVFASTWTGACRFVVYWTPRSKRLRSVKMDGPINMTALRLIKRYLTFATGKCKPALA